MNCPYCSYSGPRPELHFHLVQEHGEVVVMEKDEEQGKSYYRVQCPLCSRKLAKHVNPRGRDPSFLEEYAQEIRLVALDRLLYHLESEAHTPGGPPAETMGGPRWRE